MSRDIFAGPQLKGSIAQAMIENGLWEGRRGRLRMRIAKTAQPLLTGEYITYTAKVGRVVVGKGHAQTATDAINALESVWKSLPAEERNPNETASE